MVPVRSMKTGHIVVGYISRNPDSATTPTSEDYLDDITTDEKKIGMIVAPISFSAMRSQKLLSPSALRASSAGSSATSPRTTTNISPPWEQQQQQHHQQQRRVSFSSDRDGNGEQSGSTRLTGLGEQRQRQQRRASPDGSSSSPPTSITMRANSNDPNYDANIISEDLLQPRRRLSSPSSPLQEPARRSSPSPVVDREGRGGASADVRRPPSPSDRPHHCLERTHPHTDAPPPIAAVSTGGNSDCPNSATQTTAALHLDVVENNVRSSSPQTVLRSSAGASPSAAAALLNCEAAIDVTSPSPSSSALLDTEVPLLPTEQIPSRCGSTTAHEKEEAPPPSTTHGSAMGNAEEERAVEEVAGANVPDVVPDGAALVATPTRRGAPLMQMDDASSPLPHPFPNDSAPQPHPAVVVVAVDSTKFQDDEGGEQQGILQQVEQSRGTSSAPPTSCETSMREKETNVFLERGSAAAAALPPPTPPATTQVDNNTAPPPEANREEGDGRGELTLTDEDDDTTTTIRVAQNDHHNDDDASANPSSSVSSSAVLAPTARGKCATRKKQKGGKGSR
ncbi:Hypothetical protein, putative [Bodo saltans]|uniref:Uncharacterized protein n=1 Tax=Bodo saltans TaxID=75058 RepID=A0A0S4INF6_BODSA|nr:Hypothetical protein, putative [Bodo saltans]|eukprot:CUE83272.1 Hypothetical protein, putative [Bodo saltans]